MGAMGEPTAATLAAAALGWLVFGVLPGWLVVSAVTPGRSVLDRLAVAPAISIGLAYPAAAWSNRLGFDVALPAALVVLVLASLLAAFVLIRNRRPGVPGPLHDRGSLVAVAIPLALVTLLWLVVIATSAPGWGTVVPNSDGNAHGLLTVALLQHGDVLGFDAYPLGAHLIAALVGAVTSVPSALVVPLTLLAPVWAVLGVAAFARRISPTVVPWAAFAACVVPYFPFGQVNWGPVPLLLGVALVPGVALTVLDVAGRGAAAVAAASVAGLLAIHVTEALVAALVVLLVLLARGRPVVRPLLNASLVGLGALLLTAPLVAELVGGGAVRPQEPTAGDTLGPAVVTSLVRPFVPAAWPSTPVWIGALAVAGVLVTVSAVGAGRVWSNPHGRAIVVLVVLLLGLAVVARATTGGLLTSPWYGNGDRLVAQASALLPLLLGAGLQRLLPSVRDDLPAAATAVLVAACVGAALVEGLAVARQGLDRFSVVTPDDRLAFAWLAVHVRPGEHVLNDHRDGSVWMVEATAGVDQPLFGGKPGGGFAAYPEWADRLYLQAHVADIARDPRARAVAEQWHVRYVFSGERTFDDAPRLVDANALATAPGVTEVFRSGGARVFELPTR